MTPPGELSPHVQAPDQRREPRPFGRTQLVFEQQEVECAGAVDETHPAPRVARFGAESPDRGASGPSACAVLTQLEPFGRRCGPAPHAVRNNREETERLERRRRGYAQRRRREQDVQSAPPAEQPARVSRPKDDGRREYAR
jgi:hypothetical protein